MNTSQTPLCLVVGFLGSGKTTLLRTIIRQFPDKQLAFIVNEFSEMDVDGAALQQEHETVVCLPGGSVFCRCLAGQFIQTLQDLPRTMHAPQWDGVVVEASGIADPGVAPQMLREAGLDTRYRLTRIIAVVDPGNIEALLQELPNTKSQLMTADVILINKTDVYDREQIDTATALVRTVNENAAIEHVVRCEIALPFFETPSSSRPTGDYAAAADPNFATAVAHTAAVVDTDKLTRALNTLRQELYRAKGFLNSPSGAVYLDWTPSTCSRFDLPDYTGPFGFSFIGRGTKTPAINAIAARLQSGAFNSQQDASG